MRISPDEYLGLKLRAHEILHDVPLYDVTVVDLPGGGAGRRVSDVAALDADTAPSWIAAAFYGFRHFLGHVFRWDQLAMRPDESLLSRLSARDRLNSDTPPGTPVGSFLLLYRFAGESLCETRNATVHGFICTALIRTTNGYRLYWGVYVLPASSLTRPYLIAIEPFRRFILYPAMLRRIRRAWAARYANVHAD